MEVLGIALAALGTVAVIYLVVYTLPGLVMKLVRSMRSRGEQPPIPTDLDTHATYEIYVSLRAA
jgi:hypothetical protein